MPGKLSIVLPLLAASALLCGQTKPDPKAVVNGKTVTLSQIDSLLGDVPPENRSKVTDNPEELFRYYGFIDKMAGMGEKDKLFDMSPYKEQLEIERKKILAKAYMDEHARTIKLDTPMMRAYYEQHLDSYTYAKIDAIYLPIPSEDKTEETRAKAESIWKRVTSGANFAALSKEYPVDAVKNGEEMPLIRKSETGLPVEIRDKIFQLKPKEISRPVQRPSGFFIFLMDNITVKPFSDVQGEVGKTMSEERFKDWMDSIRQSVTVTKPE